MKTTSPVFKTPDDAEAVYYEAFRHGDIRVMAAVWADTDVICIHPGSAAIVGYDAVVRSWEHIFTNTRQPDLKLEIMKKTQIAGLAVHLVTEEVQTGSEFTALVLATNVYQLFGDTWRMTEHHASLVQAGRRGHTLQ